MKKIFLLIFILVSAFSCTNSSKKSMNIEMRMEGKIFILQKTVEGSEISISFSDGKVSGKAGINKYFSDYRISENYISIGNSIDTTKMSGPELLMDQERKYLQALSDAVNIELSEKVLTLTTNSGSVLIFKEKSDNGNILSK